MKRIFSIILTLVFVTFGVQAQTQWFDPLNGDEPHVQGRAWNQEIGKSYNRFPQRAKANLRPPVWSLSTNGAGLIVNFYTNAPEITVKYTVSGYKTLPNLTTIAVSGVDLYVTDCHGATNWCACPGRYRFGSDTADTITFHYKNLTYKNTHDLGNEYRLYLPLYNTVTSMKIGVPQNSQLKFAPQPKEKPIVVYGTSIAQGASGSRPAMAWSNIIQRRTDWPIINLGFSGNAFMDTAVYDLLSEIDAKMYILDCMPNMYHICDSILNRTIAGVKKLRSKTDAPILLVENCGYMYGKTDQPIEDECNATNKELKKAYQELKAEDVKNIFYLTREEIGLTPDSQVDGWHPSDIGMEQYADAYIKKISDILSYHPMALFTPCKQRREPQRYEWDERHNAVIKQNTTTDPEILMIGNSITHYWAGNPYCFQHRGPVAWKKLFGKKRVTNMGFGWDRIENVFWRLYHGELDGCHPQQICMMIGTNNLQLNSNEEIVEGILGLAKLIRERQPQARLHVVKIYPRRGQEERIGKLNDLLASKLTLDGQTDLIDVTSQLLLKDGSGKIDESLFVDGLHPNEKGYGKIAAIMKDYLK